MLAECDAGLIIGDLQLFDMPADHILDLGEAWFNLTGLPFVYAGWLARPEVPAAALAALLNRAREWGCARLPELAERWSVRMELPLDRISDYFVNVMQYGLDDRQWQGLLEFQRRCVEHGLIVTSAPPRRA
jgi:chorismate dehydratase